MLLCAAAVLAAALSLAFAPTASASGEPSWPTYHRDAIRSGVDPDATEPIKPFQAWESANLGAPIWGQPLVLGGRVYVATVGNDLYALDAATGKQVWKQHLGTPVPAGKLPCGDISPTVGIVGTPVIDPSTGMIFAVADTWNAETEKAAHVLMGYTLEGKLALTTPVDPAGTEPKAMLQRTALNLDNGRVIFGFGGNKGDCGDYQGTIVSAPETGGAPSYWRYEPAPPSTSGGAVWAPAGPAVDAEGHILFADGNPDPPEGKKAETYDYSSSVVQLNQSLERTGFFKPPTWLSEVNSDTDLGSAGPELLPGGLVFQAGKSGTGYLIDANGLGSGARAVFSHQICAGHGSFGGDSYAAGVIYVPCTNGVAALAYNQAERTFTQIWQGPADAFGPPIVSGGLVWVAATGGFAGGGSKLYGLDPATGTPVYTETLPSPIADHFGSPSAAGGRLFMATGSTVTAFQISAATPPPVAPLAAPAPGPGPGPSSGPPPPTGKGAAAVRSAIPAVTVATDYARVARSGLLVLRMRCAAGASACIGRMTLRAGGAAAPGSGARAAVLVLATATFSLPGGTTHHVVLHLRPRARALLVRTHPLRARLSILAHDAAGLRHGSHVALLLHLARAAAGG